MRLKADCKVKVHPRRAKVQHRLQGPGYMKLGSGAMSNTRRRPGDGLSADIITVRQHEWEREKGRSDLTKQKRTERRTGGKQRAGEESGSTRKEPKQPDLYLRPAITADKSKKDENSKQSVASNLNSTSLIFHCVI